MSVNTNNKRNNDINKGNEDNKSTYINKINKDSESVSGNSKN